MVRICMLVTTSQITNTHTHTHTCCSCPLTQEFHTLTSDDGLPSDMTSEDGSTLNAIGHALIQMQLGGQTTPSSQFLITRSTSSGSESGQKLMVNKEDHIYQCAFWPNPKVIGLDKLSKCLYILITCRTMSIIANV